MLVLTHHAPPGSRQRRQPESANKRRVTWKSERPTRDFRTRWRVRVSFEQRAEERVARQRAWAEQEAWENPE